jgi:CubicO group peptidase (beta-lactamase class C family)
MFSYCNSGYCVLGAVLARLRGGSWESVLRERLLEPLGVTHVALGAEEAILFRAAVGHSRPPDARRHSVLRRWVQPRSVAPAGATACAAPRELVRVGQMLSAGGVAADGTRLLSPAATAAMLTPQVAVPGVPGRSATHWGLGLMLFNWNGTPAFGHDGDQLGQSSLLFVVPQHRFVVALCANSNTIAGLIDDLVIPIVEDVTGIALPPRPVPPPRPAPFDAHRYVGRYVAPLSAYEVNTAGAALQITAIPQGFAAETGQSRTDRYVPLADETFIAIEPENGSHKTLTFVDSARYLHDLRAVPRVE